MDADDVKQSGENRSLEQREDSLGEEIEHMLFLFTELKRKGDKLLRIS
ncbi:MAG: hypothetical protein HYS62_00495 [Candidatus Aenigmarchaeota archaeon]|nr:hypothetical protein [Candidatus Aenigmarchaeota archaeon]